MLLQRNKKSPSSP